MVERLKISVFKGCDVSTFEAALAQTIRQAGGDIRWDSSDEEAGADCRTATSGNVQTLFCALPEMTRIRVAQAVADRLSVPWMSLYVSDSVWGYVLFAADGSRVDEFCVSPGYWESDDATLKRLHGQPPLLADVWGVPLANIERYLTDWQLREIDEDEFEFALKGRAYNTDGYSYGEIWQVFDFLTALGGKNPVNILAGARQLRISLSTA